jgi:polysaccharide export outer membrane protein
MSLKSLLFILVALISFSSCITNKDVVYLQDKGTVVEDSLAIKEASKPYRVQINDQLKVSFKVQEEDVQKALAIFNQTTENPGNTQETLYFNGNSVDLHGNIEFPILGKINVLGYTLLEIEAKLDKSLHEKYIKKEQIVYITVKLAGLKYTALGEIAIPGNQVLFQDRVNIIEAIANSGDILQTGDRTDVLIVRQYPEGQKIHHIDLTDKVAMQSEFYFIKPNDIIMVKPLKRKSLGAGQTATQTFTTIASIFSVIISTYFLARNL